MDSNLEIFSDRIISFLSTTDLSPLVVWVYNYFPFVIKSNFQKTRNHWNMWRKSVWLLFNAKRAIFQLYHRKNMLRLVRWWDGDDVYFVLDHHAGLDLFSARSQKQQSMGWNVTPFELRNITLTLTQPIFAHVTPFELRHITLTLTQPIFAHVTPFELGHITLTL
jgi:hypothetical protein